ncbi:hypothetical protein RQP46_002967 [Phenoliferia psychrophenolica]
MSQDGSRSASGHLPDPLITKILSFLSLEAQTSGGAEPNEWTSALARCRLVSKSFSGLAKAPELWAPILLAKWNQHSASYDHLDPFRGCARRTCIDQHVRQQLRLLVDASWNRIPLIASVTEHGVEALAQLETSFFSASLEKDTEDDRLAFEFWTKELTGLIGRREAYETWRRLLHLLPPTIKYVPTVDDDAWEPRELHVPFATDEFRTGFDAEAETRAFAAFDYFDNEMDSREEWTLHQILENASINIPGGAYDDDDDDDEEWRSDDEHSDDPARFATQQVVLCALLRNLPAAYDIQAWPGVNVVAVARRSDPVGQERWGYISMIDGVAEGYDILLYHIAESPVISLDVDFLERLRRDLRGITTPVAQTCRERIDELISWDKKEDSPDSTPLRKAPPIDLALGTTLYVEQGGETEAVVIARYDESAPQQFLGVGAWL